MEILKYLICAQKSSSMMPHLWAEAVVAAAQQSAPTTSAPLFKQHMNAGLCFCLSTVWFWHFNSRYFLWRCFGSCAYQRADSPPTWQACTLVFLDLLWRIKKGRARNVMVMYGKVVSGHLHPCDIGTPKPGDCLIKRWGNQKTLDCTGHPHNLCALVCFKQVIEGVVFLMGLCLAARIIPGL